jgi:hypothetical protein
MAKATKTASKKTAKKTATIVASKKKAPAAKAPAPAFAKLIEEATVQYDIKFYGGAGQIVFKGQNLNQTVSSDGSFTVSQSKGVQTVFVGGTAPAGGSGRIEAQVSENGSVLAPFSSNVFTNLFNSAITYTV